MSAHPPLSDDPIWLRLVPQAESALREGDLQLAGELLAALPEYAAGGPTIGTEIRAALLESSRRFLDERYWGARVLMLECLQAVEHGLFGKGSVERAATLWDLVAAERARANHDRAEAHRAESTSATDQAVASVPSGDFPTIRADLGRLHELAKHLATLEEHGGAERLLLGIASRLEDTPAAAANLLAELARELDELRARSWRPS